MSDHRERIEKWDAKVEAATQAEDERRQLLLAPRAVAEGIAQALHNDFPPRDAVLMELAWAWKDDLQLWDEETFDQRIYGIAECWPDTYAATMRQLFAAYDPVAMEAVRSVLNEAMLSEVADRAMQLREEDGDRASEWRHADPTGELEQIAEKRHDQARSLKAFSLQAWQSLLRRFMRGE